MFLKSIVSVSLLTALSRITGFMRDIMITAILGASPMADAFIVALKLPNLFRRLFAEGAFGVSFVPIYSGLIGRHDYEKAALFAGRTLSIMTLFLTGFVTLALIFMPEVTYLIAPGFADEPEKFQMVTEYCRITFPYLLFISLVALLGNMLNSMHFYGPFAFVSVFFNLVMIFGIALADFLGWDPGKALCYSLTISGIVQLAWLIFSCHYRDVSIRFHKPALTPEIRKLFRLMIPGTLGAGVLQINLFIDTIIASFLPAGAISFLFYADRLNQLPLGIIGVAIGTVLLPILSKKVAQKDEVEISKYLDKSLVLSLFISLPAMVAFLVIADPIVKVLFERGKFTSWETAQTAKALMAYAIGVPAYIVSKVLGSACFARENTKTPVIIAIITSVSNVLLAIILIQFLGFAGIALATGITSWLNIWLLFKAVNKKYHYQISSESLKKFSFIGLAAFLMGSALVLTQKVSAAYLNGSEFERIIGLTGMILFGLLVYLAFCKIFKVIHLRELRSFLSKAKV